MTFKVKRALLSVSLLLGFVLGCGGSQPEVKVDPVKANKPFPKAGERQEP